MRVRDLWRFSPRMGAKNQGPPVGRRRTIIRTPLARESCPTSRHACVPPGHPQARRSNACASSSSRTKAKAGGVWLGPRSRPAFPADTAAVGTMRTMTCASMVSTTRILQTPSRRLARTSTQPCGWSQAWPGSPKGRRIPTPGCPRAVARFGRRQREARGRSLSPQRKTCLCACLRQGDGSRTPGVPRPLDSPRANSTNQPAPVGCRRFRMGTVDRNCE